jgi:hypothetical protein
MRRALLCLALCLACGHSLGERPCADDSDCPSPQKCVAGRCASSGFCVGSAACHDDAACAAGQHCANGCCAPGEAGSCARDADCSSHPKTPVCDTGKGACVACLSSRDCGPGKLCQDQACVALPGCASNRDCTPPTPVCDLQQRACVQCLDSGDCSDPAAPDCDSSHHCVVTQQCQSDVDCAKPTNHCLLPGGRCVACLANADCTAPLVCDPAQNVCLQPRATSCTNEADCASNPVAPHCKPGAAGKPGTCVACLDDGQCQAGEVCSAINTCVARQCIGDSDCVAPSPRCDLAPSPHVCVACLANPDCPNGGACQPDHTCVAAGGCAGDADCAQNVSAPRCNLNTHACVACLEPADCGAGKTCTPQDTCVPNTCSSDGDCSSLPQTPHCDTAKGSCVQCVTTPQCGAGSKCDADLCKPVCTVATQTQDCPAATPRCRVNPFPACVQCVASADCTGGQICNSDNVCVVSTMCSGNGNCPPTAPVCNAGSCVQCAADADCKNGMGCDAAHTCTLTGGSGQICGPSFACNAGLLCIDEGGANGPVCRPRCNPYAPACAAGTVCAWIGFDAGGALQGFCSAPNPKPGAGQLGQACDPTKGDSCEWSLICAPTSAATGVCRAVCDPAQAGNCGANVCNAVAGAVSGTGAVQKFGTCAPPSRWGQTCVTDTPPPAGSAGNCGSLATDPHAAGQLFCSPSFLPAESPQASVLGICSFTPAAATAIGGADAPCAAHTSNDCRTGVCLSDGQVTCFAGCGATADCGRDGAGGSVYCVDLDFSSQYKSNVIASCERICRNEADCAALPGPLARTCAPSPIHGGFSWRAFCSPAAGSGKAGAKCASSSDCGSGICVTGATLQAIELSQSVAGFVAKDGFCLGAASAAGDCAAAPGTGFSLSAALPLQPADGTLGVMGRPNPGVCWPLEGCARDASCAGLSADAATPRVCAPYKKTTSASTLSTSCGSAKPCASGAICDDATNNPNPGGAYGTTGGIYGPNGYCRQVTWALQCAPSLGAQKLGPGAACTFSTDCRTGHCLVPASGGNYCFGGCATDAECLGGTHCKTSTYLGMSASFCQP